MSEQKTTLTLDNRQIFLLLCLLAAGFTGNFLGMRLFTGFNYLFGSIATLLTVRLFGMRWGLMAAIISSSWTIVLFGHPYAMVWLCIEPIFIGYLLRRGKSGNIILYDALYWPLLGVPLIWIFFQYVMHVPMLGTVAALLMYSVIGITNALAASLLMNIFPRLLGVGNDNSAKTVPIHTMIFNLMMATVIIPAVIIMVQHGRDADQRVFHDLFNDLTASSRIATYETKMWMLQRPVGQTIQEYLDSRSETIQKTLRSMRVKEYQTITIIDTGGRIITSTDDSRVPKGFYIPCQDGILKSTGTDGINSCMPKPSSPLPLWQRAQNSTYSLSSTLSGDLPWVIVLESPFAHYQQILFKEHIKSLLVVLTMNLLALLTSLSASRRLSAPLRRISQLTTDMPERLLREKIYSWPSSMIAEVDQLIDNFRVMTDALNQKFREITYTNETLELRVKARARELSMTNEALQQEIAGHKRTELQRDQLMTELQKKNKELEGIVYAASHDLRSPLINVQGFSRKLSKNCTDIDRIISDLDLGKQEKELLQPMLRESMPKSLGFIIDSIEKMDNLLNGLLRLSRLGQVATCYETLDMQAVMTKIVASMSYQAEAADAQIEVGPLNPCVADAVQINQVFSNLLDNAIKYRASDRRLIIRISDKPCNEGICYCIEDNGIGIHPDHQDTIWEIFQRINHSETQGEGLGLTMARRIVDRLGGAISVESEPGIGSRFYVTLPAPPQK